MDKAQRTWAYGELTVNDIVAAALDLALKEGVAGITMRRLAKELGLSPTVFYYYIRNKDEMLDLVINEVLSRVTIPGPDVGDWRERLRQLYLSLCVETVPYEGLNQLLQRRPLVPRAVEIGDAVAGILREAGFPPDMVPFCVRTLSGFYHGHVGFHVETRRNGSMPKKSQVSADTRPNLALLRPEEIMPQFEFGLDVVLAGLEHVARTVATS